MDHSERRSSNLVTGIGELIAEALTGGVTPEEAGQQLTRLQCQAAAKQRTAEGQDVRGLLDQPRALRLCTRLLNRRAAALEETVRARARAERMQPVTDQSTNSEEPGVPRGENTDDPDDPLMLEGMEATCANCSS